MSDIRSAEDLQRDPQEEPEKPLPFLDRPVKTNDPKALKSKAIDDKARTLKHEGDLRSILSTEAGVRFMARLLGEICCIDQSEFHPTSSVKDNIIGRRQVGHVVKDLIRDCDWGLWSKVDFALNEMRAKPKKP
jgi:hypothetical protein